MRTFARIRWTASDVKSITAGRKMTVKQAEEFLERNESRIRERLCVVGFEVIEALLDEENTCACKGKGYVQGPCGTHDCDCVRQGHKGKKS